MRTTLLATLLLSALAPAAQPVPPTAIWHLAEAPGRLWADLSPYFPTPDSGAVDDDAGSLRWSAPMPDLARVDAVVERGTVRQVAFTFIAGTEELRRMDEALLQVKQMVGPPADPPFFSAAQLSTSRTGGWADVWFDTARRRVVLRQPRDPPPPAPSPPPPPARAE